jgi:hypothetical protein
MKIYAKSMQRWIAPNLAAWDAGILAFAMCNARSEKSLLETGTL